MYLFPNQLPNKQNQIYLTHSILLQLVLVLPIVSEYKYVVRYNFFLQNKQVLTFVVFDFFRFVGGQISRTEAIT